MICSTYPITKRPILIDVDTQSHFFREDSPLCVHHHRTVLETIRRVMTWAQDCHVKTLSTLQVHPTHTSYWRTAETCRLSLQKPACTLQHNYLDLVASDRLDWSGDLWQQVDQIIVHKRTYDPFNEPRADRILTEISDRDECILIGTPVEGAILATAMGLLQRQKQVTIVSDAVGYLTAENGRRAWRLLHAKPIRFVRARRLTATCPRPLVHTH